MQANGKFYPTTLLIEVWWLGTDQPVMMKAAGFVPNEYGDAWVRQCKTQEEFDKWRSHSIALIKRFNGQAVDVAQWRPRQPEPTPVDMESIANKIKKLLALSQSPNEAEAIAEYLNHLSRNPNRHAFLNEDDNNDNDDIDDSFDVGLLCDSPLR